MGNSYDQRIRGAEALCNGVRWSELLLIWLIWREMVETYPFLLGHFLSSTDNGGIHLIKAQSVLGRDGICLSYPTIPERFSGEKLR